MSVSSFGLGIVLNFVDNASSGMNNATQTFLNMQNTIQGAARVTNTAMQQIASGTVLNTLGTSLTNFGSSMVGVVSGLMNNVKQVGSDFQLFKVTLGQLYGSATEAENQISKLLDFSVKSPFEVTDVKDMLVVLKSQGIEAFDSIKGSITGTEQETLQWINDLMAFKPDVPMARWKKALQNYIGSGNQRSLREVLDMGKVEEIIGHDIGKTTEERLNDLIEIVEKKNLTGLTDAMFGTMQQNISNIGDYFTMLYKGIGDAGVFDNLAQITGIVSKTLADFDNQSGKLPQIAQIIADSFNMILEPVVALTQKLADLLSSFLDFAIAHPALAKLAIVMFSVAGAATVALGWILRLSGSFLMLAGSIKLLGGIKTVMSTIGTGFSVLGGKLLALLPLGILLYQAWKNNFLGIQDHISNFSKKLGLVWDYFKQGYFTDEQYNLAQQLGILEAIEKIEILQYYWDYFKTGFAKGWDKTFEAFFKAIETGLKRIDTVLKNLGIDSGLSKVIELLGKSFEELFRVGKENDFENLGETFGEIAAGAIILLGTMKALSGVFKLFKGVASIFKGIGTAISWISKALGFLKLGKLFGTIGGWIAKLGPLFAKLGGWISAAASAIWTGITAIATALGVSVGWVVAAIVAIIAAVVALIVFWDEVCYFFTNTVPNAFKTAASAIGNFFSGIWDMIINSSFMQSVISIVSTIIGVFSSIGNVIGQVFMLIYQVVAGVIGTIVSVISAAFQIVWSVIVGVFNVIVSVITGIVNVISAIVGFIGAIFRTAFYAILWIVMTVWNGIKAGLQAVWNFIQPVVNAIASAFSAAWGVIQSVWSVITGFFSGLMSSVWGIISPILTNIQNAFNTAASYVKSAWQTVSSFFSGIFSAISGFASSAASAISGAFNSAAAAVKSVFDWISNAISKAGDFVNGIGSKIKSVIPGFATGVESFVGGLAVINEQGGELVDLPKGTRVIPHDESIKESLNEGIRLGARAMSAFNSVNSNGTPVSSATSKTSSNDNRVIFSKGSIVITTVGATQAEMEKAAEFIMKYIERRQKLRSLAVRV